ncbi:MAG: Lrp/AsnC family transcriptional regulator [Candidatus Micrarchaeota archaeon]
MKAKQMDNADRRILIELRKNCRRSYREIASTLAMSPATLIERMRRLEGDGVILGYVPNFDYGKLGYEFMALVEIHISARDLLAIERKIAQMPHVAAVWDVTGEYDALAVLMCKTRGELSDTAKRILALEGVERTNTNVVLNVVSRLTEFDGV